MLDAEPDLSERLFSDIDFSDGAVVAVSGGSDSTALLILLKTHLDRVAPATRLLAVTIDHDLRQGSAAEAREVARLCAERGIAHRTLVWSGKKPSSGLPAAAREARYRLLAEAAQAEGIGLILTGHTADDQAETVLMRQAREQGGREEARREKEIDDEGGRGVAGMAPATLHDWQRWIVRPLLGTRRAALREVLRRRNIAWAEDPTNLDRHFERPRVRATLAGDDGARRFAEAMASAGQAAASREELGRRAALLIRDLASMAAQGLVRLDPAFAALGDVASAVYALRILLATIGGVSFLPDAARSQALFDRLRAGSLCATLSRTVLDARRSGIFLRRESRGLPELAPAASEGLWDGRRRITLADRESRLLIAPLGTAAAAKRTVAEDGTPPSLARAALAAEPALWLGAECLGFPGEAGVPPQVGIAPVVAPFARFLPSFDLAPAAAVARLIGAPPLPALPFHGHSAG
ncbi:tRNA lysidine(34) synthetase TilS [Mesorhizobium sp. M4B.F.Ca.ET.215.01.1.1]|uniref:tRNA(Ile)-lysidine synthase n=5 Tax=Mesorhizobium TaxID=68287 RepID=A0ABU5AKH0_9HYPH|nr:MULTISPECIES: tRNA lysidine(34) synthetase TilS [Mesorhizobium]MDX8537722.1 tRNA lysidine(34) synthetase TilS [Mesorhizobium abyssinicae]RUW23323.1 tRNA lysidine(34) synthetase TilS [Mesorhizobium sp. M4B.F.Ca.ET.013.02.1.1]RVD37836.1 tRNA lysidine(34) synthetase TilS [Mesorhizobium sp. M4B.F.Ca.ET.019.03.1.1]TGQ07076.1 tRNA lysidine(34) synthetase TilS [Mesorhizobium sp. M4B.F.Ca.ET.215.01.1.1]TGQ27934.1 tRNA lysidine(34) synthetase TilS [Mesorhizobium sp. M4B.F.Ca.ET.214.01.1.1]